MVVGWCIIWPGFAAWERLTYGLISIIIQRKKKKKSKRAITDAATHVFSSNHDQLPDDIITEILSRLPSRQLMELRYVCKRWFASTSTQSFRELHYKNQPLMHLFVVQSQPYCPIFASPLSTNYFELLAITEKPTVGFENKFEHTSIIIALCQKKKKPLIPFYKPFLISSYKGFLLFRHDSTEELVLIFYNPTTGEQVTVTAPASRYLYCGFYFHSPTKEYRVLYQVLDDEKDAAGMNEFAILGLRTKSLRRIRNFSHCHPSSSAPPIILNGALHWIVSETHAHDHQAFGGSSIQNPSCLETILSFGTENEEFHVMPHPGDKCVVSSRGGGEHRRGGHSHDLKMHLMEMDGQLCLCSRCDSSSPPCKKLEIWTLEDYKEWIWVKRHVVMLGLLNIWPVPRPNDNELVRQRTVVNALFIHDGELLLVSKLYEHLYFLYNLKKGSLRRLETINLEPAKKFSNIVVVHPGLVSLHTKKFGYVLSLHEDQVLERDLDKVCQIYVVDSLDREIGKARAEFQAIIKDPFMLNNVINRTCPSKSKEKL